MDDRVSVLWCFMQVLQLLEDSSKEVRDAAIVTLEMFYTYIGPSLLVRRLEAVMLLALILSGFGFFADNAERSSGQGHSSGTYGDVGREI